MILSGPGSALAENAVQILVDVRTALAALAEDGVSMYLRPAP